MTAPVNPSPHCRPRRNLAYQWTIVTASVILITFVLVAGSWTWKPDQVLYDVGIALQGRPARNDVIIVAIDDASIAEVGQWPWRPDRLANLLDHIAAANPRSVGIDIILSEPDFRDMDDDKILVEQLRRMPNALLPVLSLQGRELLPMQSFAQASKLASISVSLDPDGVLRRVRLEQAVKNGHETHMALAMTEIGGPKRQDALSEDYLIPFIGPQGKVHRVSAAAVLRGEVPASLLSNKFVLLGVTAHGLAETYMTPATINGQLMTGIEVTANILTGLLDGREIYCWSRYSVGFVSAVAMLLLLLIFYQVGPRLSLTLMFATVFLTPLLAVVLLSKFGIWFPPMAASISALIAYPLWHWKRLEAICDYLDDEIVKLESDHRNPQQLLPAGTVGFADYIQNRIELIRLNVNYLRAARKFLSESLDGLPFAALVIAPSGLLVVANNQAQALCGLSRNGLDECGIEPALADIKPEEMSWTEAMCCALDRNKLSLKATDKAGNEYEVALASFRSVEDIISGLIVVLKDVTELRRAQREREDTLSFLSHDIRSPQNSILALAELQRHAETKKAETEFVADIEALAKKTTILAEDFLQLARADSKSLNLCECDLGALVDDCVAEIGPQARTKQISIRLPEQADEAMVTVDRSLMARAIGNLLVNAVKHTPSGGVVSVAFVGGEDEISCSIVDSGPGIKTSDLPRLFKRFSQLQENDYKMPGSGLGLAFVDVVARRHGGHALAESIPGQGARFSIVLPLSSHP